MPFLYKSEKFESTLHFQILGRFEKQNALPNFAFIKVFLVFLKASLYNRHGIADDSAQEANHL